MRFTVAGGRVPVTKKLVLPPTNEKEYRAVKREAENLKRLYHKCEQKPDDERSPWIEAMMLAKWDTLDKAVNEYEAANN
jgi:hypothetical protein